MTLIELKIKDPLILKLIETGLKCKVFESDYSANLELGTPQGGILSPLLSNIYLDLFDKYMVDLAKEFQGSVDAKHRKANPIYTKYKRAKKNEYCAKNANIKNGPF